MTALQDNQSSQNGGPLKYWRSPLLWLVLLLLIICTANGCILFFAKDFINYPSWWSKFHWISGLVLTLPYAYYQWWHFLRVRNQVGQIHYWLGVSSFFSVLGAILTGITLIPYIDSESLLYVATELIHITLGFAFTILIGSHLTLVVKLLKQRLLLQQNRLQRSKSEHVQAIPNC